MPLVCLPRPAVTVVLTRLEACPARWTDQCPRARAIRDDAIQRGVDQLAALAGFDSRSDGFGHGTFFACIASSLYTVPAPVDSSVAKRENRAHQAQRDGDDLSLETEDAAREEFWALNFGISQL